MCAALLESQRRCWFIWRLLVWNGLFSSPVNVDDCIPLETVDSFIYLFIYLFFGLIHFFWSVMRQCGHRCKKKRKKKEEVCVRVEGLSNISSSTGMWIDQRKAMTAKYKQKKKKKKRKRHRSSRERKGLIMAVSAEDARKKQTNKQTKKKNRWFGMAWRCPTWKRDYPGMAANFLLINFPGAQWHYHLTSWAYCSARRERERGGEKAFFSFLFFFFF